MATASNSDKIIGGIGIAAAVVFIIAMLIAIVTKDGFIFGSGTLNELFTETVLVIGCVIAGILGAVFGLMITLGKAESKVFIGKVRGILIVASGVVLLILGMTEGNDAVIYLFMALIILSAASDTFYNWVADQKILMILSMILLLIIALTGVLSLTGDNQVMGFAFAVVVAVWIMLMGVIRFIPVIEAEPLKKDKKGKESESKKKNAPAPRPYPAKKEEPKKAVEKEKAKKVREEPKPAESKPMAAAEPPKEKTKPAEPPKEKPIKVMSSREAAAARETVRKKEEPEAEEPVAEVEVASEAAEVAAVPVAEEPVAEVAAVPVVEEEVLAEPETEVVLEEADTETYTDTEEENFDESFEITEDTPDALLRRATWNKGLRCRRDYGEFLIPIAYVKAKVAVYVQNEAGENDASVDEKLMSKGWTVLRYKESDITDGKEQAEEISKAVKENLRADRAKKKKSSKK